MSVRILHIDTSGSAGLVMLAIDGVPVSHKLSGNERDHAGKVNELVSEVLESAACSLAELDAIAVCNGPGSYTGLRIGLATAKGYCYVLDKPLILHNRLHLMLLETEANGDGDKNRLAILPARKGEYYVALSGILHMTPRHIMADELAAAVAESKEKFIIIGQKGAEDLAFIQEARYIPHYSLDLNVWANASYSAFDVGTFTDLAYAEPEYLKSAYITASRADR